MAAGRPRTVSFCEDDMMVLGREMVDYVKRNKADILHLSEWYTIERGFTYKEWRTFILRAEFVPYYEQALKIVARKYLDKSSNVKDGIAHRWLRVYFADLKECEDNDADKEAARKADALKTETRAAEETRIKVLEEVERNKRLCA
jgi:hypothetical protein